MQSQTRATSDAPDLPHGTMSKQEAGANASSRVVASRRSSAVSRAPERRPAEGPNRRGQEARRGGRGGGWTNPSGLQQPVAPGLREPPLCFGLKNAWVGAVIGERKRMDVPGRARGEEWVGPRAEPGRGHPRPTLLASNQLPPNEIKVFTCDIHNTF